MDDISIYWKKKIKRVAKLSKEMNYPEQNEEFWKTQRAGVISLIDELSRERNDIELAELRREKHLLDKLKKEGDNC